MACAYGNRTRWQRATTVIWLACTIAGCSPALDYDDSPGNVAWREVLMTAGVVADKRIADLTLEEAGSVLGPCLSVTPTCADELLATRADLRGPALSPSWPYALREMPERLVPELIARGAVADGRAMIDAMQRRREDRAQRLLIVGHLLAAGAEVDAVDFDGDTPLHHAADQSDAALVELLLKHGADPARKTRTGSTPLQLARAQGDAATIKLLNRKTRAQ